MGPRPECGRIVWPTRTRRTVPRIIRQGQARRSAREDRDFGAIVSDALSDAGGLQQFGAHLQTLQPGAKSSVRHWHEREDEFLFVVSGTLTVVENDGEHLLEAEGQARHGGFPQGVRNGAPCQAPGLPPLQQTLQQARCPQS